jgi:hypothetical protein
MMEGDYQTCVHDRFDRESEVLENVAFSPSVSPKDSISSDERILGFDGH